MLLKILRRGIEYELAMSTSSGTIILNNMIASSIDRLYEEGYLFDCPWSVKEETGNYDYELALTRLLRGGKLREQAKNGMRVYNDASHLEFSTPVYRSPYEAMIYDKAVEILAGSSAQARLYKNNVSTIKAGGHWRSVAYGTHGNFGLSRSWLNHENWINFSKLILPYMITRMLLFGSGEVMPVEKFNGGVVEGDKLRFVISPRALFVRCVSSIDTSSQRGFLNLRDEPHATGLWRLHDINFEANRMDFATYIRDIFENFVLLALEKGYYSREIKIEEPVKQARDLSIDTESFEWKLRSDNKLIDCFDILGEYFAACETMVKEEGDQEDRKALKAVESALRALENRRLETLINGLDWITKKFYLEEFDEEEWLGFSNQYSYIDQGSLFYTGKPVNSASFFYPEDSLRFVEDSLGFEKKKIFNDVAKALLEPPSYTRDHEKTQILTGSTEEKKANWERVYVGEEIYENMEPFSSEKWRRIE